VSGKAHACDANFNLYVAEKEKRRGSNLVAGDRTIGKKISATS